MLIACMNFVSAGQAKKYKSNYGNMHLCSLLIYYLRILFYELNDTPVKLNVKAPIYCFSRSENYIVRSHIFCIYSVFSHAAFATGSGG